MKSQSRLRSSSLVIAFLILFSTIFVACSASSLKHIREHTYPPNFNYITSEQLHTTMSRLAQKVTKLDLIMNEIEEPGKIQTQEAVGILLEMEAMTASLGTEGWPSNHQEVSGHISEFRQELVAARRALLAQPPGFYLARTISEACAHCHETR